MNNKQKNYFAVILAGGQGSRFWPQSRALVPKQFLSFETSRPGKKPSKSCFFELSIERIEKLIPYSNIFIVTSELYRDQVLGLVKPFRIPEKNIIFEPSSKNTTASISIAMRAISLINPMAKVAVFPCDHVIQNGKGFLKLLRKALDGSLNKIVVFGIKPYRPATGYGYIKISGRTNKAASGIFYEVDGFFEKPSLKTAKKYLKEGDYFWNSGIFVGTCITFRDEIKMHAPKIDYYTEQIHKIDDIGVVWNSMPSISFDHGILEKTKNILMLSADGLGWSDIGSWQAWDELLEKDSKLNALKGDCIDLNSQNTTVLSGGRLIATIGLSDTIIVDTPDALLVSKKDKTEKVKDIVELLKAKRRLEHYYHKTVRRSWGTYTVLEGGPYFKVKLVEVKPKSALSLQYHKRRSEHWIVVEGKAEVVRGNRKLIVSRNESTFIPIGCIHKLSNPENEILKVIEVQAGDYLEEDDIVRL